MDTATAESLAQIVPVLLLTLLFEARAKPLSNDSRSLTILLAFIGNLGIAVTAVVVEFRLLGVIQSGRSTRDAEWIWWGSMALFCLVLLRWVSVSAARSVVQRATRPLAAGIANGVVGSVSGVASGTTAVVNSIWEYERTFFDNVYEHVFENVFEMVSYPASALASIATAMFTNISRIGRVFERKDGK